MGLGSAGPGVTRGFLFVSASANTYNPQLTAWEPMLEPWQLLLHMDHNTQSR
jgi:hypothetical protein